MKSSVSFSSHGYLFLRVSMIMALLLMPSCGTINNIAERFDNRMAEAIRSMDVAIATLAQQSADWQVVVANLEKEISKDVQSTLRVEIHDLARSAVLSTGAEVRCNAEFVRIKIRRELIKLRNSLAMELNAILAKTPLRNSQVPLLPEEVVRPFICDVVPAAVDMSLDPERRTKIDIYGFDLKSMPITASYNSYGLLQLKELTGVADFMRVMGERNMKEKRVRYERELPVRNVAEPLQGTAMRFMRENLLTPSFNLVTPANFLEVNVSPSISIISDFHAVLDLTAAGANLPPNASEILLSWDNKIQSEIPILVKEEIYECRNWDTTAVLKPLTFIPVAVEQSEYGGHPDTEFAGHGPCVVFSMSLFVDPSRKKISATIYMDAWECPDDFSKIRKDYTEAVETRTFTLFQITNPDVTITGFNLEPYLSDRYIDTNVNPDFRYYSSTAPAAKIEFVGDTNGDEAGNETGATITFNTLKVKLQKCGYN